MREHSNKSKGVELFSDLMVMKFTPKDHQGSKQLKSTRSFGQRLQDSGKKQAELLNNLSFVKQASREAVIVGNQDQLDMFNLDGLSHNYVDTFHHWSLHLGKAIKEVRVNRKREVMLLQTERTLLLYRYSSAKREHTPPILLTGLPLQDEVKFVQWASMDNIGVFYERHFEIYYLSQSGELQQRLKKQYDIDRTMKLLTVPQAIDSTVNVFFEAGQDEKTFELRCIEISLRESGIKIGQHYKIYDIMRRMKTALIVQNFSRDIILLYLGQEILVARQGYIVDSVTITLQSEHSHLRYLPQQQLLVHVQPTTIELYNFGINVTSMPHRIQLTPLDSIQLKHPGPQWNLMKLLPILDNNYVVFYQRADAHSNSAYIMYSFVMSYTVEMAVKVERVLQSKKNDNQSIEEEIESKAQILRKMGMEDRDIYLQFWQKSSQSTLQDYQLLLATNHYSTIKQQIENKMRKQSMSFKEVYKVEEACLGMMQPRVLSEQCTEQLLKDYLTCFLLMRKLKLYKELTMLREGKDIISGRKSLLINIQESYNYKKKEIKQFILEPISKGQYRTTTDVQALRIILNHFRLTFRYIYPELITDIATIAKHDLVTLLDLLPQLLPVAPHEVNPDQDPQQILYEGVWGQIPESEWEKSMFLGKIQNIYNKEITNQFLRSLWFKRNWLTSHHLIPESKEKVAEIARQNCSEDIFYLLISTMCKSITDPIVFQTTIEHLQIRYSRFPKHLRRKVPLYIQLHAYYQRTRSANLPGQPLSLQQFLRLEDYQLMKQFFELEKARKNILLGEVKGMYEQTLKQESGKAFNESILSYFRWEGSGVSDLKYLLNRINNEKRQFHASNSDMYAVLVEATMTKLRIGSPNDVPIDQVLIYLENLPIRTQTHSHVVQQLELIQKISEECDTLRKMRLNMSIRAIADQPHTVITQLVEYHLIKYDIPKIKDTNTLLSRTYRILAEVQSLKEKLYGQNYNQLTLFLYVTRLLQFDDKVKCAQLILKDQNLNNYFFIDSAIIQSIVLYAWKWKLSKFRVYKKIQRYLKHLLKLLPQSNTLRQYLTSEATYALLLTSPERPIAYPLSANAIPTTQEIAAAIAALTPKHLSELHLSTILESLRSMTEHHSATEEKSSVMAAQGSSMVPTVSAIVQKVDERSIYEAYLGTLAHHKLIREALGILKELSNKGEQTDGLGCLLVVQQVLNDLNESSKISMSRICAHLFDQPKKLVNLLEELLHQKLTGRQASRFLREKYDKIRYEYPNFRILDSQLLSAAFEQVVLNRPESIHAHNQLIKNTLLKIKRSRSSFLHNYTLDLLYIILCHDPYRVPAFLKYVPQTTWKEYRLFITQLTYEPTFDQFALIEISRRIFFVLIRSYQQSIDIDRLSHDYKSSSIYQPIVPHPMGVLPAYEQKIMRNLEVFTRMQPLPSPNSLAIHRRMSSIEQQQVLTDSINQIESGDPSNRSHRQFAAPPEEEDSKQEEMAPNPFYKPPPSSLLQPLLFDPDSERRIFIKRDAESRVDQRKQEDESPGMPHLQLHDKKSSESFQGVLGQAKKKKATIKTYFSQDIRSRADDEQSLSNSVDKSQSNKDLSYSIKSMDEMPLRPHLRIKTKKSHPQPQSMQMLGDELPKKPIIPFLSSRDLPLQVETVKSSLQPPVQTIVIEPPRPTAVEQEDQLDEILNMEKMVKDILRKTYKTFNAKLESQPYNLKILLSQKNTFPQHWPKLFHALIVNIYQQPERNYEIALRLIQQINSKFQDTGLNTTCVDIYHKVAKLQAKYGLELPLRQMLPVEHMFRPGLTGEQLFEQVKHTVVEKSDDDTIMKVGKVMSIGFRKNTNEAHILVLYAGRVINGIDDCTAMKQNQTAFNQVKGLIQQVNIKVLIDQAHYLVQQCQNMDFRHQLINYLVCHIRLKGFSKDAKQLSKRLA